MHELLTLTLVELAETLRAKKASPVELMAAVVARCDETHEALNALVVSRDREALMDDAKAAEARIAAGDARPLEGIPFAVKDLEDAAGLPTCHGSRLYEDDGPVDHDSIQVARLKAAGAIVLGKSNTPEFGFTAITKNLVHGVTTSPWGTARSPGGSSGGAAALVAAEITPLVTSSDGGGSIRIPASFTGTFGLKTSFGRVPKGPSEFWDYGNTGVYGPLTKTVEDAALFLDQVVGHDGRDPKSLPHPGFKYVDAVHEPPPRGLRIGYSPDLGYGVVESGVASIVEDAARVFEKLGHNLSAVAGGPPEMGTQWGLLNAYQMGGELHDRLSGRESDVSRSLMQGLTMARGIEQSWWGEASRRRAQVIAWCAELFAQYDVLLTPTTPFVAPPAKGPFPRETEGRPHPPSSAGTFTIPFNLALNPAASVRAGLHDGMPVGLQIVVPHHRDDLALQLARSFERERPWHPDWPLR
jgi:Asp-tRNA(Asn)/Glu-tRNA(Gln) amidotransferase A subunit family amidase